MKTLSAGVLPVDWIFCANNVCNYVLLKMLAFSVDSDP